jgi:hypothetical protein
MQQLVRKPLLSPYFSKIFTRSSLPPLNSVQYYKIILWNTKNVTLKNLSDIQWSACEEVCRIPIKIGKKLERHLRAMKMINQRSHAHTVKHQATSITYKKLNSVVLVRKRTIPTKRPQPADKVSAKFS